MLDLRRVRVEGVGLAGARGGVRLVRLLAAAAGTSASTCLAFARYQSGLGRTRQGGSAADGGGIRGQTVASPGAAGAFTTGKGLLGLVVVLCQGARHLGFLVVLDKHERL